VRSALPLHASSPQRRRPLLRSWTPARHLRALLTPHTVLTCLFSSFCATDTRRDLYGLKISGTIPIDVGQMTELQLLCVSLLLPAPRPRAAPPRSPARALCAPRFVRALHARRSLTALSLPSFSFLARTFAGTCQSTRSRELARASAPSKARSIPTIASSPPIRIGRTARCAQRASTLEIASPPSRAPIPPTRNPRVIERLQYVVMLSSPRGAPD
jgi:hypothetical protein